MLSPDKRVKEIGHYFPDIGRGNISHDTIPHKEVENGLDRSFRRSFIELLCNWLDI